MATVWAYRIGSWTEDSSTGWSHTISMQGLSDLCESLMSKGLQDRVRRLAIVAHGDQSGLVQLDRNLTSSTINTFAAELTRLAGFLTRDAMLIFYSCVAGAGEAGSQLLVSLSSRLPNRTIIGFEMFGLIGTPGLPNAPGRMQASETSLAQLAVQPGGTVGELGPFSRFAKWARNGAVVRFPILEQNNRPGRRCANPQCPGHAAAGHRCHGW